MVVFATHIIWKERNEIKHNPGTRVPNFLSIVRKVWGKIKGRLKYERRHPNASLTVQLDSLDSIFQYFFINMQELLYQYKCIGNKMLNTFDLLVSTTNELAKKVYVSYLTCPSEKKATLYFMIIMCAICNNYLKIRPTKKDPFLIDQMESNVLSLFSGNFPCNNIKEMYHSHHTSSKLAH